MKTQPIPLANAEPTTPHNWINMKFVIMFKITAAKRINIFVFGRPLAHRIWKSIWRRKLKRRNGAE